MNRIYIIAVCLALPLAVDGPAHGRDSSATRVSIAGGGGAYALIDRGCEGQVISAQRAHFTDGSAAVEHKFANPLGVGVRGGLVRVGESGNNATSSYVNPFAGADWTNVGFGGGYVYSDRGLPNSGGPTSDWFHSFGSGHLRLGPGDRTHLMISVLESEPLISGGGYFDLGLGFHPGPGVRGFIGLSAAPYDGPGAALRGEVRLAPQLFLNLNARLGASEGLGENAGGVGLTYRKF